MSPPAGRKKPDLLHKKIHVVNFFVQKKKRAMLPQANRAIQFNSIQSTVRFASPPHKSCYSNPQFVVVPSSGGWERIPTNQFTTTLGLLY
jgi:hypothetical protein